MTTDNAMSKELPDWNDNSREKPSWELELEEYGDLHNNPNCQCNWEEPDGCDCDMGGLKPLVWKAVALAEERGREKEGVRIEEGLRGLETHGLDVNIYLDEALKVIWDEALTSEKENHEPNN